MSSTILSRMKHIISEQLGVEEDQITQKTHFTDDLDADSLDTVELVMAIEEEFKIEIPDQDAEKIATLEQAIKFIEDALDTKDPS